MTINIGFDFDETLHFNYQPSYLLNLFIYYYINGCKMYVITKNQHWSAKDINPVYIQQDFKKKKGYMLNNNKAPISKIHLWLEHYCNIPGIASNCTVIGVPYTTSKGRVICENKIQVFFDDYDVFLNAIKNYVKRKGCYKIMLYKISEKKKRDDGRIESLFFNGHDHLARIEGKKVSSWYKKLTPPAEFFADKKTFLNLYK